MLQRKLEREMVIYGGAPPANGSTSDGSDVPEEDEDGKPAASISGILSNMQSTLFKHVLTVCNFVYVDSIIVLHGFYICWFYDCTTWLTTVWYLGTAITTCQSHSLLPAMRHVVFWEILFMFFIFRSLSYHFILNKIPRGQNDIVWDC